MPQQQMQPQMMPQGGVPQMQPGMVQPQMQQPGMMMPQQQPQGGMMMNAGGMAMPAMQQQPGVMMGAQPQMQAGGAMHLAPHHSEVDGALVDVAVGQHVWGVNAQDMVFRRDGAAWTRVEGALKRICAAADGSVYGVNATQEIWKFENGHWVKLDGAAVQVSCGSAHAVWVVNQAGQIWRRDGATWTNVPNGAAGAAKEVCVGVDGSVYMVSASGAIFHWENNNWTPLPGAVVSLSVYDRDNIVGCNAAGQCWRLTPPTTWSQFAHHLPNAKRVSIGPSGCWVLTADQKIHKYDNAAMGGMMPGGM